MPATTAQDFYLATVTQDQALSGAATIRGLTEAIPAASSATTVTFTTTAQATKTVVPYADSQTASDTSQNNGWAFGNGSGSAGVYLSSASDAQRIFPAGSWTFGGALGLNIPALLATVSAFVTVKVYRVATGGGARTLLFSAQSNTATNNSATAASTTLWTASSTQPQIVLAAGEAIEVGYTVTSAATANTVGTVTNTVVTFYTGTNATGNARVSAPTPGVRTQYNRSESETTATSDSLARQVTHPRAVAESTSTSDALTRALTASRAESETTSTSDALARAVTYARAESDSVPAATDSLARRVAYNRATSESTSVSDALARRLTAARALVETTTVSDQLARQIVYGRSFSEYPPGVDPDYPVAFPTREVAGTVYNHETGAAYAGGATVRLFRDRDDKACQTLTSDGAGRFSFTRDLYDPNTYYYTATFTLGGVEYHGVSDRGQVPTAKAS